MRFKDKTVVITGASSGLGKVMAAGFAKEGARVAVIGTHVERTEEAAAAIVAAGGQARPYIVDIADESAVKAAFARIVDELGDVDTLINNAAIAYGDIYNLMQMDSDLLARTFAVNVCGPLFCARAALDSLTRRSGSIINLSSISAYLPSGAYSLTKAAVNNLTIVLATELSPYGIRVNGIAPGRMESDKANMLPPSILQAFIDTQLVKRSGTEQDIVNAAMFLASGDAAFMTAQTLLVDGGFLAHAPKVVTGTQKNLSVESDRLTSIV